MTSPPKQEPITVYDKWTSFEVEPGVRCSSFSPSGELVGTVLGYPEVKTTWDVFNHGLGISAKRNCIGWRSGDAYQWWTYEQVHQQVGKICAAFKAKTPFLTRQQNVGIYSACVREWLVLALAINARSMCIVPLYDTLGPESRSWIIKQAEISVMFVDTPTAAERLLDEDADETPLKTIICLSQEISGELVEKSKSKSINLVTLADFISNLGDFGDEVFDFPNAEDVAEINYTSGTTGLPKGAIITHRAFVADVVGVDHPFALKADRELWINETDCALLFLPLSHMYAQVNSIWFFLRGASIGIFGGNVLKIVEDASILKPTFIAMVPRVMNRVYAKVTALVGKTGFKAKLFWYCYKKKRELMVKGIITRSSIWDLIAFKKIQRLVGGNLRLMSCGSAPIANEVLEFWRVCFGTLIGEGYGMTECTVIATMAIGPFGGNVGHPCVCNYVKLIDCEECGYFHKDGKGEVCLKGPNIMSGYYKQPDKTAEALDTDGWFRTGDIGEFLPGDGALRIFDRKKHIFKLNQGEYIAPEKVENVYLMSPFISQIFVDGSSLESFSIAIIVPDETTAKNWSNENNVDPKMVASHRDFVRYIYDNITKVGRGCKLNSLEQVKNIYLTSQPFTPNNGLLTPSMKNRRPQLRLFYKNEIDALYQAGPLIPEQGNGNNGDNDKK